MTKIQGGCLCGAVTYGADIEKVSAMSCYCTDCQHATGSSCATFVAVPTATMELNGEPKGYSRLGESGREVTRYFCADCGCQLYSEVESMPGVRFVKVGTLDNLDDLQPKVHIWTSSRPKWLELPAGAAAFEKNPG